MADTDNEGTDHSDGEEVLKEGRDSTLPESKPLPVTGRLPSLEHILGQGNEDDKKNDQDSKHEQ